MTDENAERGKMQRVFRHSAAGLLVGVILFFVSRTQAPEEGMGVSLAKSYAFGGIGGRRALLHLSAQGQAEESDGTVLSLRSSRRKDWAPNLDAHVPFVFLPGPEKSSTIKMEHMLPRRMSARFMDEIPCKQLEVHKQSVHQNCQPETIMQMLATFSGHQAHSIIVACKSLLPISPCQAKSGWGDAVQWVWLSSPALCGSHGHEAAAEQEHQRRCPEALTIHDLDLPAQSQVDPTAFSLQEPGSYTGRKCLDAVELMNLALAVDDICPVSSGMPEFVRRNLDAVLEAIEQQLSEQDESICDAEPAGFQKGLIPTALVSYPGSGNTVTRMLIEMATGVLTGSVYHEPALTFAQPYPFRGERTTDDVVCIKTHFPAWTMHDSEAEDIVDVVERAVVIVRDPHHALPSRCNYIYGRNFGLDHTMQASEEEWLMWRDANYEEQVQKWLQLLRHWLDKPHMVVIFEHLVDASKGPGVFRDMISYLTPGVPDDLVNCTWHEVMASSGGVHRTKKYHPEFLEAQQCHIAEMLRRAARKPSDPVLAEALHTYIGTARCNQKAS